jgi:hypothetical protein
LAAIPDDCLKNLITVRIHLDDAEESNGALKVIPGSHNKKLNDEEIAHCPKQHSLYLCGGGLRHSIDEASAASQFIEGNQSKASPRDSPRVQLRELPNGMQWAEKQVL